MSRGGRGRLRWRPLREKGSTRVKSTVVGLIHNDWSILGFWSIWRFYLWRRRSAKLWAARGSRSLWRTAAVQVLCCLTEKTGLHQCSLEVEHNTDRWCHGGEGREEQRACRNHTTGFIHTYPNTMLLLLPGFNVVPNDLALYL